MSSRNLKGQWSSKDPWSYPHTPDHELGSQYAPSEDDYSVTESGTRSVAFGEDANGLVSFIYFPKEYADPLLEKRCSICNKTFHFFRRDFYCQLCGHMVCGDCSQLYEFDDEDLLPALGPILVEAPPDAWESSSSTTTNDEYDDLSSESDMDDLTGQLCSEDPGTRSRALEMLGRLVGSPASSSSSSVSNRKLVKLPSTGSTRNQAKQSKKKRKTQSQRVLESVENHVTQELAKSRLKYTVEACDVNDRTRDYKLIPLKSTSPQVELRP
ncbi:uncharacterized protein KRP23_279 [Phytophthora ramorum]|uniref:uncharacterized protein n=1 Tax=Phytophthora ramorum TaxID=164328 RepID=UPI0030B65CE9|nr:hypothetical protein KRP23_279 [Phytophthora ramorum]